MQGFCASLELLPMWSGLEPDVELFASGRVLDDDGEWAGGQTLDNTAQGAPAIPPYQDYKVLLLTACQLKENMPACWTQHMSALQGIRHASPVLPCIALCQKRCSQFSNLVISQQLWHSSSAA